MTRRAGGQGRDAATNGGTGARGAALVVGGLALLFGCGGAPAWVRAPATDPEAVVVRFRRGANAWAALRKAETVARRQRARPVTPTVDRYVGDRWVWVRLRPIEEAQR